MAEVQLTGISKMYDGGHLAVRNVTLTVESGEFFTLLGPSGCGKTTTLRMVAGLETPTEGQIRIGGRDCTSVHPRDRKVALVFQSYALYPHMTAFGNIALNLKIEGVANADIERRVQAIAKTLRIDPLLHRRPKNLSGGERQRVALARALRNPEVLLMDEPLSNLDLKLREHMRTELRRLHYEYRHTVICVTHDQAEAMTMSDRIAVMRDGVVEQIGTPEEVYLRPANTFAAAFLGTPSLNLLPGRVVGGAAPSLRAGSAAADTLLPIELGTKSAAGCEGSTQSVLVGVRPEDVLIGAESSPDALTARIRLVEPLGANKFLFLEIWQDEGPATRVVAMVPGHEGHRPQERVSIRFRRGRLMVFDGSSQNLIGFGQIL